jgi:hypothetical protein
LDLRECVITGFNFSSIILFLEDEDDINLMFSLNMSTPDDGSVSECRICKVSDETSSYGKQQLVLRTLHGARDEEDLEG